MDFIGPSDFFGLNIVPGVLGWLKKKLFFSEKLTSPGEFVFLWDKNQGKYVPKKQLIQVGRLTFYIKKGFFLATLMVYLPSMNLWWSPDTFF